MTLINGTRINQLYNIDVCPVTGIQMIRRWRSDFVMQTRYLRKRKKKSMEPLNVCQNTTNISACRMSHGVICCYTRYSYSQLIIYGPHSMSVQGADGKLSTNPECTRQASMFSVQGGGEEAKGPAWLLRGIPNVMSLLIPSGKHS